MKKNYIAPCSKTLELATKTVFTLSLSETKGQGTGRGEDLTIGDGTEDDYVPGASVKGYGDWGE